eukprot:SAG31_NODE_4840_length_2912_cov_1.530750_2_plen_307_part_00
MYQLPEQRILLTRLHRLAYPATQEDWSEETDALQVRSEAEETGAEGMSTDENLDPIHSPTVWRGGWLASADSDIYNGTHTPPGRSCTERDLNETSLGSQDWAAAFQSQRQRCAWVASAGRTGYFGCGSAGYPGGHSSLGQPRRLPWQSYGSRQGVGSTTDFPYLPPPTFFRPQSLCGLAEDEMRPGEAWRGRDSYWPGDSSDDFLRRHSWGPTTVHGPTARDPVAVASYDLQRFQNWEALWQTADDLHAATSPDLASHASEVSSPVNGQAARGIAAEHGEVAEAADLALLKIGRVMVQRNRLFDQM